MLRDRQHLLKHGPALWATTLQGLSWSDCNVLDLVLRVSAHRLILSALTGVAGRLTLPFTCNCPWSVGCTVFAETVEVFLFNSLNRWREEGALTEWGILASLTIVVGAATLFALVLRRGGSELVATCASDFSVVVGGRIPSLWSCRWYSRSWPIKCRFGDTQGRLFFTKS